MYRLLQHIYLWCKNKTKLFLFYTGLTSKFFSGSQKLAGSFIRSALILCIVRRCASIGGYHTFFEQSRLKLFSLFYAQYAQNRLTVKQKFIFKKAIRVLWALFKQPFFLKEVQKCRNWCFSR